MRMIRTMVTTTTDTITKILDEIKEADLGPLFFVSTKCSPTYSASFYGNFSNTKRS